MVQYSIYITHGHTVHYYIGTVAVRKSLTPPCHIDE